MCGLTGIIYNPGHFTEEYIINSLKLSNNALYHRGPDSEGYWMDQSVGIALAHRRLAILDLSSQGHQPMLSASGRFIVAYNGEIYNFLSIKRELEGKGFQFRSNSDTEVMLAAFEEWGIEASVGRFAGMFAIACWDKKEGRLYLIRDRLGKKPIYLAKCRNVVLFSSEIKALHNWPNFVATIDRSALAAYLRCNYIPAPLTIYEQVRKLPPASILTLSREDLKRPDIPLERVQNYWSAREVAENGQLNMLHFSDDEAVEQLDTVLRQAVSERMISDVPLGAFLSGGIDSSTVVALMQAQSSQPIRTFTIGFDDPNFNEAKHAKSIANHLGTEHVELYVSPSEAQSIIPLLPSIYDEPFADSSQIPTFLISRLASNHVTVALSGDGGDETFGGYNRHFLTNRLSFILSIPHYARHLIARTVMYFPPARIDSFLNMIKILKLMQSGPGISGDRLHKLASILQCGDMLQIYYSLASHWSDLSTIISNYTEPHTIFSDLSKHAKLHDFQHFMMWLDTVTYLPDDILVKLDRASMAVSLETRCPLLDHRVIEFAWRLPLELKVRRGTGKWILRRVLERYIPLSLFERPKMGFGIPLGDWLRGPLREWAEDLLSEHRLRREGYFYPEEIRQKWRDHVSGHRNWGYHLWDILMFQAWHENWASSSSTSAEPIAC